MFSTFTRMRYEPRTIRADTFHTQPKRIYNNGMEYSLVEVA